MPNKLTDSEIVKALECRVKGKCPECPYFHSFPCDKCKKLDEDALDLINRYEEQIATQQAEIERLTIRLRKAEHQLDDLCKNYNVIKAEAYKECIEKVEQMLFSIRVDGKYFTGIHKSLFDNLLKELVGEDNRNN